MKLVIIYGPEASGKLTIATQLSKITGFKLFHNHISIEVAKTLFDYGMPGFSGLVLDVRTLVFSRAAEYCIPGILFTWAYSHPHSLPELDKIRSCAKKHAIEINYVYVTCEPEERNSRVQNPDRVKYGKISSVDQLLLQNSRKSYQPIPDVESLLIDNTYLQPFEVARQIADRFSLPRITG